MPQLAIQDAARRYQSVDAEKAHGVTYTPDILARFVADRMVESANLPSSNSITILDPAIGDGALVLALLSALHDKTHAEFHIRGFDTNISALDEAARRIHTSFPKAKIELTRGNFIEYVLDHNECGNAPSLFSKDNQKFDFVIANPPYVRTQIMGSERAQQLANAFSLSGRVDLYQAFLLGIAQVLAPNGTAGIIVSNRFMTTKGGAALRAALRQRFDIRQIWDLGDTKLFNAAVLPAVMVARGIASSSQEPPSFTAIYETKDAPVSAAANPIEALARQGVVEIDDGRRFCVRHGVLDGSANDGGVWRLASASGNEWMATVDRFTWKRFGEIGKIRVGVKTCADKVFIRHDWDEVLGSERPELLKPLITHHGAGRFREKSSKRAYSILYPHEVSHGVRRAVPLDDFPKSRAYLEANRKPLEGRSYVIEAGRRWYELWVPQDPQAWSAPKLVFRDISERPTFWIDLTGSVVNGDCYWLVTSRDKSDDLIWLAAAVANSTFAEAFYDHRFNNKLYAGRRRFITQYVEQFPLPDPSLELTRDIIVRSKSIFEANHGPEVVGMERDLDAMIWRAFGLSVEEVRR